MGMVLLVVLRELLTLYILTTHILIAYQHHLVVVSIFHIVKMYGFDRSDNL
jgi:hypothetical protein